MADCPYCGSSATVHFAGIGDPRHWAFCDDRNGCGAIGPVRPTRDEAAKSFSEPYAKGIRDMLAVAKRTAWTRSTTGIDWSETDEEAAKLAGEGT